MDERRLPERNAILAVYCDALAASGLADLEEVTSSYQLQAAQVLQMAKDPPHHACLSSTPVTYEDQWSNTVALNLPKAVTL